MKVRVLGCSGAIAKDCRTTSFLMDDNVLIDAGTGVGDLSLTQMGLIDHVFLTHSHLDHIAALPLMADSTASIRTAPVQIYALASTLEALKAHIFNGLIWPDFTRLPTPDAPLIAFNDVTVGQEIQIGNKSIEVLPAVHSVPAVAYSVKAGNACWVFSGDTERNPEFWKRLQSLEVSMLVIETAFSSRETELALRTKHLSPVVLASELGFIGADKKFPIYITHTKPAETELIMSEIEQLDQSHGAGFAHDIRWLKAGEVFEL
jgi:ribonuclease BN (tRNA processing enzyme)